MPDAINGAFELAGGLFLFLNCYRTYRAKMVRGISVLSTSFFAAWGAWNLFYYPHLGQWYSFAGGCVIVCGNVLWIGLMVYYTRVDKKRIETTIMELLGK